MLSQELEDLRLGALKALDILDTGPEPAFDDLTALACQLFKVPIALVSLIDADRQWFKSCIGLGVNSTDRDIAFCDIAIRADEVMVVHDAKMDARFCDNPLVTGEPNIRFYAGAPVRYQGVLIGTLCVIDRAPRPDFGRQEAETLRMLAAAVSSVLAMRRNALVNLAIMKQREAAQKTLGLVEDVAGVGQWSFDLASGRVAWSDQVFRIHGLPVAAEAPSYSEILSLYDPDDAAQLAKLVEHAARTGQGYAIEARIRTPSGAHRNVVAKAVCLLGSDGAVESLTGVFQEVTQYRDVISRLEVSEAGYRLLADNVPGMVGYWDAGLKCRFANNAYIDWFDRTPESLIGEDMRILLGPELFALNKIYIDGVLAGRKQTFERAMTRRNGSVGYTLAQYVPDITAERRVAGFYVLVTDITNVKLKELALSQANTQLIEARKAAEAAMAIKSQFLATMSHEIRTPLTTILGYANLLHETDDLSPEAASYVQRIGKASRTLLGLVNDVLDMSRLESGLVALNPRATRLRELGEDIADQFQLAAQKRGLDIKLSIDPELPAWVLVDDQRLNQVLNNLIGNACKFGTPGTVSLAFRAIEHGASPCLRVEITDEGPGLDDAVTGILFQRFQQGDSSINRKYGGSGLGLAISAEIIELMQGRIGVTSKVGEGSTFWFEVPLAIALEVDVDDTVVKGHDSVAPVHVLLVDDHAVNRQLIHTLLQHFASDVDEAASGQEAIEKCSACRFDVIFMDIQMPEVDGVAAARAIRAGSALNADTPIVALTALDRAHIKVGETSGLFADHLSKPVDAKKLKDALLRATRLHSRQAGMLAS